jgi:hypothetical protein
MSAPFNFCSPGTRPEQKIAGLPISESDYHGPEKFKYAAAFALQSFDVFLLSDTIKSSPGTFFGFCNAGMMAQNGWDSMHQHSHDFNPALGMAPFFFPARWGPGETCVLPGGLMGLHFWEEWDFLGVDY